MTAPVFPVSSPHATAENAGNEASPVWAGHIFGKNKRAECGCMHES